MNLKGKAIAMGTSWAGRGVGDQLAVLEVPEWARSFVSIPPASDASHLIEGLPIGKRIVGGMNDDQASAIFYVVLELQAEISWPIGAIIVKHNYLISAELGHEVAEAAPGLRGGSHCNSKETSVFQLLFQNGRGQLPVVIRPTAFPVKK
jgi:hypothetical protein